MPYQISPEEHTTHGYTMKMSSRYHRLLIYYVKRTTKIDGMGPFNQVTFQCLSYSDLINTSNSRY